jgi:hypothetical protein
MYLVGITFLVDCSQWEEIVLSEEHNQFYWKTKEEILEGDFPDWLKGEVQESR